jgi:hypothetical protein
VLLPTQKIYWYLGQVLVSHVCNPSYSGGTDLEDHGLKPARTKSKILSQQKYPTPKRAGRVAPVVESQLNKCEILSSNPNTTTKKKGIFEEV